ncbi:MAG TPA: hypothetical protein VGY58_01505 [Gemmataceae bacterium]|jgi:hypothetical protein|nr:hypothetical protein [Gemmataceae bacterium]
MRALCLLFVSLVMTASSVWLFFVVSQLSTQIGVTLDGTWYDVSGLTMAVLFLQFLVCSYATMLSLVMCIGSGKAARLRETTEQTMSRAAETIKDMILDFGADSDADKAIDKPEHGTEMLPPLSSAHFVASMRGKIEQTLSRVAEVLNQAETGTEIAASEAHIKSLLGDLRFDAIAMALQMRNDANTAEIQSVASVPGRLTTRSGKAKSYPASEHWRPVWVERFRNMRASDTAFRLAGRARERSDN